MKPLRKNIDLTISGETVSVSVDWEVIEIVETVFGGMADLVVTDTLVNYPPRHKVADVICQWVAKSNPGKDKAEVRSEVITARHTDFSAYVGAIQGAVLYSLREIDESQLDDLTSGKDLDEGEGDGDPT